SDTFPHLRAIILGGEAVREHDVTLFNRFFPEAVFANVYGQSESTLNTISLTPAGTPFKKVVLGEPMDETEILLIDDDDEIVEEIGTGEIVIVSDYLAAGYWKDPEETEYKFTHDPELGFMYWTGDLGAFLGSGDIEILGRRDFQVKIRGFRVETGEIESCLLNHPRISEAAVTAWDDEDGEKYLCAYIVGKESDDGGKSDDYKESDDGEESDDYKESDDGEESVKGDRQGRGEDELRQYLFDRLPDYMVPSRFVFPEKLPLTSTGKVDRNALPEPKDNQSGRVYVSPRTEAEKTLAQIWSDVIYGGSAAPEPIGLEDNFFQLGGHSL
ncbi:MAG: non-ribosomal peptide synthetase, partial [bacterium]|nr:non-ribosomal peptide synthetase [bacterium]